MPRRDTLARKQGMGRPTTLSPHVQTVIESAVRRGQHINTACHIAGITTTTFYRWMDRAERATHALDTGQPVDRREMPFVDFRATVLRARAEAAETMVDVVFNAAVGGRLVEEEPALDGAGNPIRDEDGRVIMKRKWTQPDGRLALSYLKVAQPSEWAGAPSRLELSGPGGSPLQTGDGEPDQDAITRMAARLAGIKERRLLELGAGPEPEEEPDDGEEEPVDGEIVEDGEEP